MELALIKRAAIWVFAGIGLALAIISCCEIADNYLVLSHPDACIASSNGTHCAAEFRVARRSLGVVPQTPEQVTSVMISAVQAQVVALIEAADEIKTSNVRGDHFTNAMARSCARQANIALRYLEQAGDAVEAGTNQRDVPYWLAAADTQIDNCVDGFQTFSPAAQGFPAYVHLEYTAKKAGSTLGALVSITNAVAKAAVTSGDDEVAVRGRSMAVQPSSPGSEGNGALDWLEPGLYEQLQDLQTRLNAGFAVSDGEDLEGSSRRQLRHRKKNKNSSKKKKSSSKKSKGSSKSVSKKSGSKKSGKKSDSKKGGKKGGSKKSGSKKSGSKKSGGKKGGKKSGSKKGGKKGGSKKSGSNSGIKKSSKKTGKSSSNKSSKSGSKKSSKKSSGKKSGSKSSSKKASPSSGAMVAGPSLAASATVGKGYKSIQDAVDAAPGGSRFVIYIPAGTYKEQVLIDTTDIVLIGAGADKTIITGDASYGSGSGTYESATVGVDSDRFVAFGIKFVNTAGPENHQAVAFRATGDQSALFNCAFEGSQDTLYVDAGRQYYKNCYIGGTQDFIFGDAAVVIDAPKIQLHPSPSFGTLTASGRSKDTPTGIVIRDANVAADSGTTRVYLGRPWKKCAFTVFINANLPAAIEKDGWLSWNEGSCMFLAEAGSKGPGAASSRVDWAKPGIITDVSGYDANSFTEVNSWLQLSG
ncbi:unnamed protein product [Closterium sp. NIES-54]